MIWGALTESLTRTFWIGIVVVPLLFLVEYLNHEYGGKIVSFFEKRSRFMPFWSSLLSLLPGCNVAAAIALLYTKGFVSLGALVSAMIATSDEAIYVFIPQKFNFLPLFGAKFILAIIAGFLIDIIVRTRVSKEGLAETKVGMCCSIHEHHEGIKSMAVHTARHAVKIILFVFVVLFGFNLLKDFYGFEKIADLTLSSGATQPIIAGIFGLLPGCGTSVVLATLYTQGIVTFAGALSGLSVASGDTLIVLLAGKVPKKKIAQIIVIVLSVGISAGYLVQIIGLRF